MSIQRDNRGMPRGGARSWHVALLLFVSLILGCSESPEPGKPDIVLLTVDSLRADRPGFMGGPVETPAMDRLAGQGTVFTEAISPSPQTLPSMASIHTGLYPPSHGVRDDGLGRLEEDHPTLASVLGAEGYRTGGFAAALALHPKHGLDRGFETYAESFRDVPRPRNTPLAGIPAPRIADRAIEWLGEGVPDRPFFLWVNFFDPHFFHEPPAPFKERYPDQPYHGEIALVDRELGRLLDWLENHPRERDLLVVLAGNHGEGLGDGGERYHGILLRESTLRVPVLIRGAGVETRRIDTPVSLVDLAPTILDLAGLEISTARDGASLAEAARGGEMPGGDRALYFETTLPRTLFGWSALRGARAGSLKYVEAPGAGWSVLHDLASDPGEETDISESRAADAERLAATVAGIGGEAKEPEALSGPIAEAVTALGLSTAPPAPADRLPVTSVETGNAALQGHRSLKRRMHRAADFLFKDVLAEDPGNYLALVDSASMMMSARQYDGAVDLLRKAQARYPSNGEIYHLLGHLAILMARQMEDLERAKRLFEMAVRLDPMNEEALYDLACATSGQDPEAALGYLERAVANGFRDYRHMSMDGDLNPIRNTARFQKITGGNVMAPPPQAGSPGATPQGQNP